MVPNELEAEIARLRAQVTELQASMTRMTEERRADDLHCQVYEFHRAMGIPTNSVPGVPSDPVVRSRLVLGAEEFCEQLSACFQFNPALEHALLDEIRYATIRVKLPELVDAWADSEYISRGSAIIFGVDMKPHAREVHRTNMAKVQGGRLREDGKVLKPKDWKPPEIARILLEQGWQGSKQ